MSKNPSEGQINSAYQLAKERYAALGVDTSMALKTLRTIAISLHCWQGDDVGGFENPGDELGGGLATTGNYPGKARNAEELRGDLDVVYSLLPGSHRLNLHAIYLESEKKVERNKIDPRHFSGWKDWAKANGHGVDFNPTCFSHPKAADGFTLSHHDESIRQFWVEHNLDSGCFEAVQEAGITALSLYDSVTDSLRKTYQDRRDTLIPGLKKLGLEVDPPPAAFYVWVMVPKGYTSTSFTAHLLEKAGIVTTPGNGFGAPGEGYIRMTLCTSKERLAEAVERI